MIEDMERIFLLKLENGAAVEARADISLEISPHDFCVFTKDFYTDMGCVCREIDPTKIKTAVPSLPLIQRLATPEDMAQAEENEEIAQVCLNLSNYYRYITKMPGHDVKLRDEVDHIHHYLEIQRIRFSARLTVETDELPEEIANTL